MSMQAHDASRDTARERFVRPTAAGMFRRFASHDASVERRLLEWLVLAGRRSALKVQDFSSALNAEPQALARALFTLQHDGALVVTLEPSGRTPTTTWSGEGLDGIAQILVRMTEPGQRTLLSTSDGFPVARAGCSAYEADVWAVQQADHAWTPSADATHGPGTADSVRLHLAGRDFVLSSSQPLDRNHDAWLELAYRILAAFQGQATPAIPKG